MVDLTAPNGSASTIEANSNPPSSNAHHTNGLLGDAESPVLHMKRAPADHSAYGEGDPRGNIGVLSRETYGMMSSPAAQHMELPHDQGGGGQRWAGSGMRPLNSGPNATSGQPGGSGRQDAARAPMTQRSGLGTISVGNGLFGVR